MPDFPKKQTLSISTLVLDDKERACACADMVPSNAREADCRCHRRCDVARERAGRAQVAYVPQAAFIYNATVRENILFGLPYEEQRYQRAIQGASLGPDLLLLTGAKL